MIMDVFGIVFKYYDFCGVNLARHSVPVWGVVRLTTNNQYFIQITSLQSRCFRYVFKKSNTKQSQYVIFIIS